MNRFPSLRRPLAVGGAALLCLLLAAGCERPREDSSADPIPASERSAAPTAPESAATPPPGRHALTAVPPIEAADLDRMFVQGFSTEEVLAAIRQRGVLRAPDPLESTHIGVLPGGGRLVEAMTSPDNLLMPVAAETHARYRAAGVDTEQMQNAAHLSRAGSAPYPGYQAAYYPPASQSNSSRRRELSQRIARLRQQYTEQTRRGESGAIVGMEIERLQRELDALPPY